jgi:hypothetical protein
VGLSFLLTVVHVVKGDMSLLQHYKGEHVSNKTFLLIKFYQIMLCLYLLNVLHQSHESVACYETPAFTFLPKPGVGCCQDNPGTVLEQISLLEVWK